jgi:hypothetical protein
LNQGRYEQQKPNENNRYWIAEINLFLGVWQGKKAEVTAYWLRWWDLSGNLLLWGSERVAQTEYQLEQERMLRQKLAEKLRELGVEPETL